MGISIPTTPRRESLVPQAQDLWDNDEGVTVEDTIYTVGFQVPSRRAKRPADGRTILEDILWRRACLCVAVPQNGDELDGGLSVDRTFRLRNSGIQAIGAVSP